MSLVGGNLILNAEVGGMPKSVIAWDWRLTQNLGLEAYTKLGGFDVCQKMMGLC